MPSLYYTVTLGNIVDKLWGNLKGRCAKHLGKWTHSFETHSEENIIFEFRDIKVTNETSTILQPHISVFQSLLDCDPLDADKDTFNLPAVVYVHDRLNTKELGYVPGTVNHYGYLTALKHAEIAHWFYLNIPGANKIKKASEWLLKIPYAHAVTVYIAAKYAKEFSSSNDLLQAS
ncbi:hypothetical protein BDQ17DRAFT_1438873 [Cyathus striatus]|nr:hypothetical protein BDQ17DRAFT_1438873 [Cyathus striatus]